MVIDRNSWHYKLWNFYCNLKYSIVDWHEKENTNLCTYMKGIFIYLPITLLIYALVYSFGGLVFPLIIFIGLLIGIRPSGFYHFEDYSPIVIKGYRLYPIQFIILLLPVAILLLWNLKIGLIIIASLVVLGLIVFGLIKLKSLSIFKNYFTAKKRGICPIIEFKG